MEKGTCFEGHHGPSSIVFPWSFLLSLSFLTGSEFVEGVDRFRKGVRRRPVVESCIKEEARKTGSDHEGEGAFEVGSEGVRRET